MLERREFLKLSSNRQATSDGYWLHVHRPAMACRFEVTLPLRDQAGVSVARRALDEVDRLEQQLTVFRESSEVSLINRNAAAAAIYVEPLLFELLLVCQELHLKTEGAFDITSGPFSHVWGFLKRQGRIPHISEIEQARSLVGSEKLLLDRQSRTIRFDRPGIEINLGSIGKGYALDRLRSLLDNRVQTALLSAGSSSILAIGSGDRGHNGWTVGIRHPRHKQRRLAILQLRDVCLSTSGSEEQFFVHDGQQYSHIIDPRSGWPAQRVTSVTVIAPQAAIADALATAFFVGGSELAERYCAAHAEVLVILLESGAEQPILIGNNEKCEVEIINEGQSAIL